MTIRADRDAAVEGLAERMAYHAHCEEHPVGQARNDCPYCADRSAYLQWLAAGGADYRPAYLRAEEGQ